MNEFFLGIDVSKGYADFVMIDNSENVVIDYFQLDDTPEGYNVLLKILKKFSRQHSGCIVYAAVESTGGYERNWYKALLSFFSIFPIQSALLNPYEVAKFRESMGKRNVTDSISAFSIASYVRVFKSKIRFNEEKHKECLSQQWTTVSLLEKQKKQLLNHLHMHLYTANPEILSYTKSGVPKWVLLILQEFPTSYELKKARKSTLLKIPHVTERKANELKMQLSKNRSCDEKKSLSVTISQIARNILQLEENIEELTNAIFQEIDIKEVDLLTTIPGVDKKTALGILIDIGSIKNFSSAKQFASYVGVHPVFKISGDGVGKMCMSKRGKKETRRLLYMAVLCGIKYNPIVKALFEKLVKKGVHGNAAIGQCMHKLTRIIYGILKSETAFSAQIDSNNTKNNYTKKLEVNIDFSRRFQNYSEQAPISGRQMKKRKMQQSSQVPLGQ